LQTVPALASNQEVTNTLDETKAAFKRRYAEIGKDRQ